MKRISKEVPNCVPLEPGLEKSEDDPCWEGYVMLGMKPKNANRRPQMRRNNIVNKNDLGRNARFHEGPKGQKEFEEWKAEQPKEFQEEWDANTEEYGDQFKQASLSISDYRRMLTANPINQGVFESGAALSGVDPALAKYFIEEGSYDGNAVDDVIEVNKGFAKAINLKPSQTTMVPINSVGMALAMLNGVLDTDLGAIIASDGQIMDGHHRWAGAILAYGDAAKVGGWFAKLPGKDLVRVLNIFTKGKFNRGGKSGQGNIAEFTPAVVRGILEDGLVYGVSSKGAFTKPEDVEKALYKLGKGDVQAGIQIMSDNASKINKDVPSWAPKRKDMPVIEPGEVPLASKYMSQGLMDWAPPYKKASRRRVSSFRSAFFRRRG